MTINGRRGTNHINSGVADVVPFQKVSPRATAESVVIEIAIDHRRRELGGIIGLSETEKEVVAQNAVMRAFLRGEPDGTTLFRRGVVKKECAGWNIVKFKWLAEDIVDHIAEDIDRPAEDRLHGYSGENVDKTIQEAASVALGAIHLAAIVNQFAAIIMVKIDGRAVR